MHKLLVAFTLGIASFSTVQAQSNSELLVSLNSGIPQTQGVAMVLANQALAQKTTVRVLLCSDAGKLALKAGESTPLKPSNKTPKEMLQGLIKAGAKVEVCALFLPNTDMSPSDLAEGIGVAKPAEIAGYLLQANVKTISF